MQVFTIVESPIVGDALGALRMQAAADAAQDALNAQGWQKVELMDLQTAAGKSEFKPWTDALLDGAQMISFDSIEDLLKHLKG